MKNDKDKKVCSHCRREYRVPYSRYCRECWRKYMREYRKKHTKEFHRLKALENG